MKSLLTLVILAITLAYVNSCSGVCKTENLNEAQCKTYCDARKALHVCRGEGFKNCKGIVGHLIQKRICYAQKRKDCMVVFDQVIAENKISFTKCRGDYHCREGNFCKKWGNATEGKCIQKPKGWCRVNSHCPTTSYCETNPEETDGLCREKESKKKTVKEVPFKRTLLTPVKVEKIKELTEEEMAKRIAQSKSNEDHTLEGAETCGNEHAHIHEHHHHDTEAQEALLEHAGNTLAGTIPPCGKTDCDDPSVRDTFTRSPGVTYKIFWIWYNCDSSFNARAQIEAATTSLNSRWAPVGIQFRSELSTYACGGRTTFTQSNTVPAIEAAHGTRAQIQAKGGFTILVGATTEGYAGWMYYPTSGSYSGIGFMNKAATTATHTTLAHELGHAFGMPHTFQGIDQGASRCDSCYETESNSNVKGDFCSDTPNIPKNWECSATLNLREPYCGGTRTTWTNPHTNLMSYGNCRTSFSQQQIRRARCYAATKMTWLKPITGTTTTTAPPTTTRPPTTSAPTTRPPTTSAPTTRPPGSCFFNGVTTPNGGTINWSGKVYKCVNGGWQVVTTTTTAPPTTTRPPTTTIPNSNMNTVATQMYSATNSEAKKLGNTYNFSQHLGLNTVSQRSASRYTTNASDAYATEAASLGFKSLYRFRFKAPTSWTPAQLAAHFKNYINNGRTRRYLSVGMVEVSGNRHFVLIFANK